MSETKEIDIMYKGKKEKATIRRMGWAEKNSFSEKYVQIQVIGDTSKIITHPFEMRTGALLKCLISAPFIAPNTPLGIEHLDDLNPKMLEDIYLKIDEFNSLGDETKKKLPGLSGKSEKEKK